MRIAGKLAGCPFFVVTDDDTGDQKFVCEQCGMETQPDRDVFLEDRLLHCKRIRSKGKKPAPAEPTAEAPKDKPKSKKKTPSTGQEK